MNEKTPAETVIKEINNNNDNNNNNNNNNNKLFVERNVQLKAD